MVAKIISGKSIRGILSYNEEKVQQSKATLIMASGFGTDINKLNFHQKVYRFEQRTQLNVRTKTNALHISLNFHSQDELNPAKLQQIAAAYMEKIGFGEQPFIVYQHSDTHHPHLHIATINIDQKGERIDINKIGWRLSEPARKELEKDFGLTRAQGRKQSQDMYLKKAEYGAKPAKKQINTITGVVMRDYAFSSFAEYKAVLAQFNIHADRGAEDSRQFAKQGIMYSIMGHDGQPIGVPFKASSLFSQATMSQIEKKFKGNIEKRKAHQAELKQQIDQVLGRYETLTKQTLLKELASEQVALVFRQNDKGLIYGATFIDHRNRTVFNGSDLGKAYAAKALTERLSHRDEPKRYLERDKGMRYLKEEKLSASFLAKEKGLGLGEAQGKGLLDGLLEKAAFDPIGALGRRRKRRRKKGHDQGLNF